MNDVVYISFAGQRSMGNKIHTTLDYSKEKHFPSRSVYDIVGTRNYVEVNIRHVGKYEDSY